RALRLLVIEVEGLRIELTGERLDLRRVDDMGRAREPPSDGEVLEKEATLSRDFRGLGHAYLPRLESNLHHDSDSLYYVNAAQELRQHALPDRPQPRARGRMVEHAHFARRPARDDALRSVPEKPRHRPEHARATAQCAGRRRAPQPPPLQRKAAAQRVPVDRARTRFPPGAARAAGLGQPAFRARGRERAAGRRQERRRRGSDLGGPGHGAADQYAGLRAHRRPRRGRAHAAKVRRAETLGGRTETRADDPQTPRAREDCTMSVAALGATVEVSAREAAVVAPAELSPRT